MTNEEHIAGLTRLLSKNDWFDSVGVDQFGKLIVFVHFLTKEVMESIPDQFESKRVVYQFSNSKSSVVKSKYATEYKPAFHNTPIYVPKSIPVIIDKFEKDPDIKFLISELNRLENICGSNILQDLFYEIHDGKNAVTKLSVKYPEVYDDLLDLYDEFGFDIIYGELDG